MNAPKLRFKGFNDEWKYTSIGECSESLSYGLNAAAKEFDGINQYIRITDIDDQSRAYLKHSRVSPDCELTDEYLVVENDILFARTGASTGKSYLYKKSDGKLYFAGFLIRARIKESFSARFIYTITLQNSYNEWVKVMSMRSGQPGINAKEYSSYSFLIPSLNEQHIISTFFELLDKKIQLQQEKIDLLKQQKKGFMQKIFSKELRFKDDNGQEFPEWKRVQLKKVCSIYDGTHQTPNYQDSGIKFVSVENITNLETSKYISEEDYQKDFKIRPEQNDILMTRIGDIGTPNIIKDNEKYAYYVSLALIKCKQILPDYLLQEIQGELFQRELFKRTLHVAFPKKINKAEIGECYINLPSQEEQKKIAIFLSRLDYKINAESKKILELNKQKQAFMQQMFI